MKENARRMMRMTIDINKTYFNFDSTKRSEFMNVITCNTCHRGNPFPAHE
jgi:ribosomal protein L31